MSGEDRFVPGAGRTTRIVVACTALALTAVDHFHAHRAYLGHLNLGYALIPSSPLRAPPTAALARRVVVVFVDGLGFDAGAGLPTLERLASLGTRRLLAIDFPSFTFPAVVAVSTGMPPLFSGVRINHAMPWKRVPPTLLDGAAAARIPVRIADGAWSTFRELLDPSGQGSELSLASLLRPSDERSLDFVYLGEVDRAGHARGGRSEAYRTAALGADTLVGRIAASLDLSRDALIVISDHGHLPRGGHGGVEATVCRGLFVAAGAGIQSRAAGEAHTLADVPPTIAALLGTAPPASSLGRPMLDVLDAQPTDVARILAATLADQIEIDSNLTGNVPNGHATAVLAALRHGDASAIGIAQQLLGRMARDRIARHEAVRLRSAAKRVGFAFVAAALLAAMLVQMRRTERLRLRPADLLPSIAYLFAFAALFLAAGYRVSWSIPRGEPGFLVETALFGAAGAIAAFAVSLRRQIARLTEETAAMLLVFGLPYLFASAWVGTDATYLAEPAVSFLVPLLATLGFYAHGPFGAVLLVQAIVSRERTQQRPVVAPRAARI